MIKKSCCRWKRTRSGHADKLNNTLSIDTVPAVSAASVRCVGLLLHEVTLQLGAQRELRITFYRFAEIDFARLSFRPCAQRLHRTASIHHLRAHVRVSAFSIVSVLLPI